MDGKLPLKRGTRWDDGRTSAPFLRFAVHGLAGAVVLDLAVEMRQSDLGGRVVRLMPAGLTVYSYVPIQPTSEKAGIDLLWGDNGYATVLDNGEAGLARLLLDLLINENSEALFAALEDHYRAEFVPAETEQQRLARERELGAEIAEARAEGPPAALDPEAHTMTPTTTFGLVCLCGWTTEGHGTSQEALAAAERHVAEVHGTGG